MLYYVNNTTLLSVYDIHISDVERSTVFYAGHKTMTTRLHYEFVKACGGVGECVYPFLCLRVGLAY